MEADEGQPENRLLFVPHGARPLIGRRTRSHPDAGMGKAIRHGREAGHEATNGVFLHEQARRGICPDIVVQGERLDQRQQHCLILRDPRAAHRRKADRAARLPVEQDHREVEMRHRAKHSPAGECRTDDGRRALALMNGMNPAPHRPDEEAGALVHLRYLPINKLIHGYSARPGGRVWVAMI